MATFIGLIFIFNYSDNEFLFRTMLLLYLMGILISILSLIHYFLYFKIKNIITPNYKKLRESIE
jgi:hypothetical protein